MSANLSGGALPAPSAWSNGSSSDAQPNNPRPEASLAFPQARHSGDETRLKSSLAWRAQVTPDQ
eukprot:1543268-Pyramimonas_sp.AAC.1